MSYPSHAGKTPSGAHPVSRRVAFTEEEVRRAFNEAVEAIVGDSNLIADAIENGLVVTLRGQPFLFFMSPAEIGRLRSSLGRPA